LRKNHLGKNKTGGGRLTWGGRTTWKVQVWEDLRRELVVPSLLETINYLLYIEEGMQSKCLETINIVLTTNTISTQTPKL
jgi:hypothetical protein